MIQKVVNTSHGEDVVRIVFLDETIKEQRQVVMVIEFLDFHLMHHTHTVSPGPVLRGGGLNGPPRTQLAPPPLFSETLGALSFGFVEVFLAVFLSTLSYKV